MDIFNSRTISITPETLVLISEIDEFKRTWRGLHQFAPEQFKRVETIEDIGSSTGIEGVKMSDQQVVEAALSLI